MTQFQIQFVFYSICLFLLGAVVGWLLGWYEFKYLPETEPEDEFEIEEDDTDD